MIRRPPRSTRVRRRQRQMCIRDRPGLPPGLRGQDVGAARQRRAARQEVHELSLIHISEPTRLLSISYAVFCLKKKKKKFKYVKKKKQRQKDKKIKNTTIKKI